MGAKAVVLEIDGDSAVVLREGGQFLRVPLRGRRWYVGQEVHLEEVGRRPFWRPAVAWAAAATLLVAVFSSFLVTPAAAQPAGYVTVDLDPARVGLVTDPWAAVRGIEPLTDEAVTLVDAAAWVGLPADRVIVLLVERAAGRQAPLPRVVVIAAAPLVDGHGLPPAVRQAVARAQQEAERVLRQRPETVTAAVITVEEPEVGARLAQLARKTGLSVFQTAALLGAQLDEVTQAAPAVAGRDRVAQVLARLAAAPADEVRRAWPAAALDHGRAGEVGHGPGPASGTGPWPVGSGGGGPAGSGSGGGPARALRQVEALKLVARLRQAMGEDLLQLILPLRGGEAGRGATEPGPGKPAGPGGGAGQGRGAAGGRHQDARPKTPEKEKKAPGKKAGRGQARPGAGAGGPGQGAGQAPGGKKGRWGDDAPDPATTRPDLRDLPARPGAGGSGGVLPGAASGESGGATAGGTRAVGSGGDRDAPGGETSGPEADGRAGGLDHLGDGPACPPDDGGLLGRVGGGIGMQEPLPCR